MDVPDVRESGREDFGEREDVLIGHVASDTDLAPGDGERLRSLRASFYLKEQQGSVGRLALDVIALVIGRHFYRVVSKSAFDSHHGVNGSSFDSRALACSLGDVPGCRTAQGGQQPVRRLPSTAR